jgi:hypothetical protein
MVVDSRMPVLARLGASTRSYSALGSEQLAKSGLSPQGRPRDIGYTTDMSMSAALAAELVVLTEALDDPDADLNVLLGQLAHDAGIAVPSFLGLAINVALDLSDSPIIFSSFSFGAGSGIASSLLVPISAPDASAVQVVFYAGVPGAFIGLAADAGIALGLAPDACVLDAHLTPPPASSSEAGSTALSTLVVVNRAVGVLVDRGFTPEAALQELRRRAEAEGSRLHDAAQAVLRSVT